MSEGLSGAGFDIDLAKGKLREGALGRILAAKGNLIEIKSDKRCRETGNLFIEYQQPSGASGLTTTEAQWWAFEYEDDCWLVVPIERLKQAARRAWKEERKAKGGDYNNYEGVLVPIDWLVFEEVPESVLSAV